MEKPSTGKRKKQKPAETVYALRRPYWQLGLGFVLFGIGAVFFWHRADTNDRGLIINGIIQLGPDGADIFYAVMALLSLAMSLGAAYGMVRYFKIDPFQVVLSEKWISLPVGPPYRMKEGRVFFREIHSVMLSPPAPAKPVRLVIQAESGVYGVLGMWMRSPEELRLLAEEIVQRMRAQAQKAEEKATTRGSPEEPSS